MGLTRKKIKVRSKSGRVYQRSVMVKSGGAKSMLKKHGLVTFAAGVAGGLAGGAVHGAIRNGGGGWLGHPSTTRKVLAVVGGMQMNGLVLDRLSRTKRGRQQQTDVRAATPWGRASMAVVGMAGSAVGQYAAHRAVSKVRDHFTSDLNRHVGEAFNRYRTG